jgi:hypothetical protein
MLHVGRDLAGWLDNARAWPAMAFGAQDGLVSFTQRQVFGELVQPMKVGGLG